METRAFASFIRRGREGMEAVELRSLRVSDDTVGGYLAPGQFVTELLRNLVPFSPVRSVARVSTTSAAAVLLPKRTGGMTAKWVGEVGPRPETTVTFGQSRYEVRELACWVDVSNQLLEDSAFDIADELAFDFAEEFGRAEGEAFVNGAGVLRPLGFMQDPTIGYVATGSASAVTADSLLDLYHAIPSPYRSNAVWMMNSATTGAIRKLKDGQGNYLLINGASTTARRRSFSAGRSWKRPTCRTCRLAASRSPSATSGTATGSSTASPCPVLRDPYSQATNGLTRFHGRRRVAAGVAKSDAIRKLKIATS